MNRRQDPFSVLRSRRFLASAVIGVLAGGIGLSVLTGINPIRLMSEGWSAYDAPQPGATSLTPKTALRGERIEGGPSDEAAERRASGKRKKGMFRRLFGRCAALFARRKRQASAAAGGVPEGDSVSEGAASGSASAEGRDVRFYGMGADASSAKTPVLDSREFGVGSVGLGLQDNGGPIALGAELPVSGLETDPAADSYFDPVEEIPQVEPVRAAAPAAAQVGAAEAGGIGFEEGPQGSANGQTSGMRVGAAGSRVAGPAVPGGTSDRSSPPGADDSGPGKPGGAALKKHKVEIPSIGGGKGIRNAPSRTY